MHYVYLIRSISRPDQTYVGCTENLEERLVAHNSSSSHHTKQYKPWKVVVSLSFEDKQRAIEFERYLKSGSGRAFAEKRFW
jgi:putative endonuclease